MSILATFIADRTVGCPVFWTGLATLVVVAVCVVGTAGTARGAGAYFKVDYSASTTEGELQIAVTYTVWIPDGVKTLRGIIVHQHGAGTTASKEGSTAAYDLHWQALARKWDCALLGPSYHVTNEKTDYTPGGSKLWFDPLKGSEKAFLKALTDLAAKSGHPELDQVPWALWGHSGGAIWADIMATRHPERVAALYLRSGCATMMYQSPPCAAPHEVPEAVFGIPTMANSGIKEKPTWQWGAWNTPVMTVKEYRARGGLIAFAPDPRTDHECGDCRYLAIPFFDACLAARLPDKWAKDRKLKAMDTCQAWLAPLFGDVATPAAEYKGDPREAVWLPNAAVAKAWMECVKTGAVGDTTPPPTPTDVKVAPRADNKGKEVTWSAEADFESGIRQFIIIRDGKEIATVPQTPVGKFGRPLFQSMTYHDTPDQPLPEMKYVDASVKGDERHTYQVVTVNGVGLRSNPTAEAPLPYLRLNSTISYAADPSWPERRKEIVWGPMSGAAVDAHDNIWVLSRTGKNVIQYQADGKFLQAWGEGMFGSPHELKVDPQGNVWVVDSNKNCVRKFTSDGKELLVLGTPGESGCDEKHFGAPTDVALAPDGGVYISDGYGNARVVHFDKDGKFVKAWGKLGIAPGEFNLPHAIAVDSKGRVYVADRNNARIQIFDADGKFLDQWRNIVVPCAFCMTRDDELWVVGTSPMTWRPEDNVFGYPPKDQLLMRFDTTGRLLQLWSVPKGEDGKEQPGDLNWAHGLTVDSKGNIYVVDVMGKRAQKFVPSGPDKIATEPAAAEPRKGEPAKP
jgi:DNA-binding beta-propeller fold protein YncE/pimeloyl-ACP methyl ester carboxylesterase